jgi:AcrR family transcriptional regulator
VIWLETGLQLLIGEGESALTIDRLCRETKKTKGSFYHHFAGQEEFRTQLIEWWKSHRGPAADRAMRRWPAGRPAVEATDRERIEARALQISVDEGWDLRRAREVALLETALVLGMEQLFPEIKPELLERTRERLYRQLRHNVTP